MKRSEGATGSPLRTLLASCGGTFVVTFDGAAVQMVLPALRRELHAGVSSVQWMMTAFLLATTAVYLPTGRLGDSYGHRRVWGVGLALFLTASLGCALLPSLPWLIAARALQAVGAAAITANSAPLLVEAFPADQRARALALGSVAIGLGLLLGPSLGALLARGVTWRALFVVALPLGLACGGIAYGHLPAPPLKRARVDVWGSLLSAAGLGAVVVGASMGRRWGWRAPHTQALLGAGLILLAAFVLLERRRADPLLRLRLFQRRSFLVGAASCLLAYAALFTVTASMPFYLVEVQGRTLIGAGLLVGVVPVALGLTAPLSGWIADRAGARWVCAVGLGLVAAGLLLAALTPAHAATAWTVVALAAAGAGLGAYESPNSAASLSALPADDLGIGAATFGVVRNLGMTIGAALAGNLLGERRGVGDLGHGHPTGVATDASVAVGAIHQVLAFGAACAALGAVIVALRPSGRIAGPSVDQREQQR